MTNELETHKAYLLKLIKDKEQIEASIREFTPLSLPGEQLVDQEGFPRADVDVHGARIARNKLSMLHNDFKAIMKRIDTAMLRLHELQRAAQGDGDRRGQKRKQAPMEYKSRKEADDSGPFDGGDPSARAFYLVNQVYEGSPRTRLGLE
eukprot:g31500.t1